MGGYVGLAKYLECATCAQPLFVASSGLFGQRIILPKKPPPGAFTDDRGHATTFQCYHCAGKEPKTIPTIHPNGQSISYFKISELEDADDLHELIREEGDYNARDEIANIYQQQQTKK
jgi:hypothetical protein